jgi:hypothetical protein
MNEHRFSFLILLFIYKFLANIFYIIISFLFKKILLDREKSDRMSLENQLREKIRELQDLQARYDQERNSTSGK